MSKGQARFVLSDELGGWYDCPKCGASYFTYTEDWTFFCHDCKTKYKVTLHVNDATFEEEV